MSSLAVSGKSIELEAIDKSFGATQVLLGFDLTIQAGSFCTLLGASGSGKTTLLKLIAGFELPDAGVIRIGGRDVGRLPVARRNIGMVFQNYALFPHMRVSANVRFGLDMRRVRRADADRRVEEVLALVGLEGFGGRHPRELSGGQQQRVALARALVIRPDILLMDEPLGALDRGLRQALQLQLKALQARLGVTVAFVTHDQEEAMQLSDTIVLLNKGRIEQVGSPREMYLHPRNRYVATFLGECNCVSRGGRTYGIRPEKLRVGPAAEAAEHALDGVITDLSFLGSAVRIGLRCGDEAFVALSPVDEASAILRAGHPLRLGYSSKDAMPLA